ncbi:HlyD family secretion protein [Pedobacter sp. AW31-3R]|uniref:HlyD family secretion protein n=1 Tax=Pedobacter sp. AW31-3R TaxID=3445781 RepID=UPI003F9FF9E3
MKVKQKVHPVNVLITVLSVVVIFAGLIFLIQYLIRDQQFEETNDAQIEAFINPVSARVGGFIREVRFQEHEPVKRGDTLLILDDREYKIKLLEAEAAIQDAKGQLTVLEAGITAAEAGIFINRDQINAARSRLWQQEQDIKRYKNLIKEEAATGQEFERVKSQFDIATSDYNATLNNLKANLSKIEELKSRRELLAAGLKSKEAQLDFALVNLSYTVITAPSNGAMGRKTILEGQQIQPGQPLVSIVNEREKWVTANFKETQVTGMYVGQAVEVRVDAIPDRIFTAKIEAIAASTGGKFSLLPADNSTGNFVKIVQRVPVKIKFSNTDLTLVKAGMNVQVAVKKQRG